MTEVDLVKRLRHRYNIDPDYLGPELFDLFIGSVNDERSEAADEIERLRAELKAQPQQKELITNSRQCLFEISLRRHPLT